MEPTQLNIVSSKSDPGTKGRSIEPRWKKNQWFWLCSMQPLETA